MTEIGKANVQPLAFVHNQEIVYVEGNSKNVQKKFSCFKVFKLKGPIDVNYLLNIIFSPYERDHYDLEVSEYNGQSAKVKFNFTNGTHEDLIQRLQNSAAKLFDLSENGLIDWLASDTVTFRTIYQNTDLEASRQLCTNAISSRSSNDNINQHSTSSTTPDDLQLYPIMDEEAIEKELNELSERISSQTNLKNYELERLIHSTFQRRDMTITISDLSDEYFGQIRDIVTFIGSEVQNSVIEDTFMLDSNTIVHTFARYLFKYAEAFINTRSGVVLGFVRDYKFGVILTLWNLINAFHSIQVSYQVLIEADVSFKRILKSQKMEFMNCISVMDKTLMDLLIILYEEIDNEKYERLQRRLEHFVKAAEDLMKLVMIINNECNKELEKLENQENSLSKKLAAAAITIVISAAVIGGYIYNTKYKLKNYEKYVGGALVLATGVAETTVMVNGYTTKVKLQNTIQKQTNILNQLGLAYREIRTWKNLGNRYIVQDIDNMNNHRMTLIDEFVRIRIQCKCLGDIFNVLDENDDDVKRICG